MVYFWPNLQTWISILIEKSHLPHISWHLQRDWTTKKCESVTFLPFLHKPKKIIQNSSKPKSLPSLKLTFSHLKINAWKTTVVSLEFPSPGRCYVSVREGTIKKKNRPKNPSNHLFRVSLVNIRTLFFTSCCIPQPTPPRFPPWTPLPCNSGRKGHNKPYTAACGVAVKNIPRETTKKCREITGSCLDNCVWDVINTEFQ